MSLLENPWVTGAAAFCVGSLVGYWLLRWKERNLRAAAAIKEQTLLESARLQAENIAREARVLANEESLKLRERTEQSHLILWRGLAQRGHDGFRHVGAGRFGGRNPCGGFTHLQCIV